MTFRLLGLPEEIRLAIEQAGGEPTEEARVVYEAAVNEAVAQVEQTVTESLREVQSIIGPHGTITRLQTGGIRVSSGEGIGVYQDGVFKTNIQPNGTMVIGSDISDPTTTTEIFFVEDTVYNNEEFGAGDFLIGDNSESTSNVKFDASEGQLQFRYGTTVNVYMDTDGTLKAGGGVVTLDADGISIIAPSGAVEDPNSYKFVDSSGNVLFQMAGYTATNTMSSILQTFHNGAISISNLFLGTPTSGILLSSNGSGGGNVNKIVLNSNDADVDTNINWNSGTAIVVSGSTGETQIDYGLEVNSTFGDYDTIINGDTKELIWANAGLDGVGIGGDAESGYILKAHGKVNLTTGNTYDINGSPHTHSYLPSDADYSDISGNDAATDVTGAELEELTDGSETTLHSHATISNDLSIDGAVTINDSGADKDTRIEGDTDPNLFVADAGLDGIGIGGAAESGFKAKVHGHFKVTNNLYLGESLIHSIFATTSHNHQDDYIPVIGWQPITATWTRTGDHTFTVSGDVTTTYRKGTKVQYQDGGGSNEYGVIASSSYSDPNTTVNLVPNSSYAMAAGTISPKYLSYIENPLGWPIDFSYSPTWTNLTVGNGTVTAKFQAIGNLIKVKGFITFGSTTSISGNVTFTVPVTMDTALNEGSARIGNTTLVDTGTNVFYGPMLTQGAAVNPRVFNAASTYLATALLSSTVPFTWTTGDQLGFEFEYRM